MSLAPQQPFAGLHFFADVCANAPRNPCAPSRESAALHRPALHPSRYLNEPQYSRQLPVSMTRTAHEDPASEDCCDPPSSTQHALQDQAPSGSNLAYDTSSSYVLGHFTRMSSQTPMQSHGYTSAGSCMCLPGCPECVLANRASSAAAMYDCLVNIVPPLVYNDLKGHAVTYERCRAALADQASACDVSDDRYPVAPHVPSAIVEGKRKHVEDPNVFVGEPEPKPKPKRARAAKKVSPAHPTDDSADNKKKTTARKPRAIAPTRARKPSGASRNARKKSPTGPSPLRNCVALADVEMDASTDVPTTTDTASPLSCGAVLPETKAAMVEMLALNSAPEQSLQTPDDSFSPSSAERKCSSPTLITYINITPCTNILRANSELSNSSTLAPSPPSQLLMLPKEDEVDTPIPEETVLEVRLRPRRTISTVNRVSVHLSSRTATSEPETNVTASATLVTKASSRCGSGKKAAGPRKRSKQASVTASTTCMPPLILIMWAATDTDL